MLVHSAFTNVKKQNLIFKNALVNAEINIKINTNVLFILGSC